MKQLRGIAEAANDGTRWKHDEASVYCPEDSSSIFEDPYVRAEDAEHIATFDPPTVLALLDVAEAAAEVAAAWSDIESRGDSDEDSDNLRDALAHLQGVTDSAVTA